MNSRNRADIARGLSDGEFDPNYNMAPSPNGGVSKPSNTSRKLNYGINNIAPEGESNGASTTPTGYPPTNVPMEAVTMPSPAGQDAVLDAEDEGANQATLQALLSPTTGGQYANNGISGVNSPYMNLYGTSM